MKTKIKMLAIAALLAGCTHVKHIGSVNMISTRNVSVKENYVLVKSYAGAGKRELKRNKGKTIEDAVNNLVRSTPGGEYLMNVKMYMLNTKYFAVDGDVYGLDQERNFKGFKVGDRVKWKDNFVTYKGIISSLKDDREAVVKQDENEKVRIVRYNEMTKIE